MLYLIDLFCGGGGTSTGASLAEGVKVIYCVNHDPLAIKSHAANHPDCIHTIEDIRKLDLTELLNLILKIKQSDPNAKFGLWASLECTNHSKAKGGLPRDADSRTLAFDLYRYLKVLPIDIVYIENVREFMIWGPLDNECKPINDSSEYNRWVEGMKAFGYSFDWKLLNAADYGAYTSRTRYFAQFAKDDVQIVWPEPTHAKNPNKAKLNSDGNKLKKWKAVKEVLDLNSHGESIFKPGRIKSLKTWKRLWDGLLVHYAGCKEEEFLQAYYGTGRNTHSLNDPCPVVPTKDRFALVKTEHFLYRDFSSTTNSSIENPAGSVTTVPKLNLVSSVPLLINYNSSTSPVKSIDEPSPTVTAVRTHGVISAFLMNPQYNSKGSGLDKPCFTLIARMDKMPPYLIQTEEGHFAIEVYETDNEYMVKIKQFMAYFGLSDIKMRMLFIEELLQIQGFPSDYKLFGTQADKKKFIGNAVEVTQAMVILATSAFINNQLKQISA